MFDYRLSFDVELKSANDSSSNSSDKIQVIIISRKDVLAWKNSGSKSSTQDIAKLHYFNSGQKINDIFRPSISDAYAFILSNRLSSNNSPKKVDVTLVHTWQQEIKESQLKDRV
jgi:hypothetical protein